MQKELWTAKDVAVALSVSVRHVWKLLSSGKLPKPVRLAGSVRWRRHELEEWMAASCPCRDEWEAGKAVAQ